jgi:multiple sugar transport system permease protein/sn-glycerol 3-phosphate transport system permease protein
MVGTRASQAVAPRRATQRRWQVLRAALAYLVLGLGSLAFLVPLAWMLGTSLMTSADTLKYPPVWISRPPAWENYPTLFERFPFWRYTLNSFFVTLMTIAGTLLSCSLAAYGFARLRMPGRDAIFVVLLSTLMLPAIVLVIPQFVLFQRLQWINTYYPLIVPAFFGNAFYIFLLRQFFLTLPRDLEDAARIDGASYLQIYARIILPLSGPALLAVALFSFVATWNDFLGPLIYLSDAELYTVPVALRYLEGGVRSRPEHHLLMAAATLAVLPCVLVFLLAQRWFIQGTVITGSKG